MRKSTLRVLLPLLIIAGLLTACGQTGPLYLPGQKAPVYIPPPQKN
jgi:predicted small lipoprotein YifL